MNEQNPELGRDGNLGFHQDGSSPTGGAFNILGCYQRPFIFSCERIGRRLAGTHIQSLLL
jgi:hypothetical protein